MTSILVVNGPNLNLLGRREPGIYGTATLADVESLCKRHCQSLGVTIECRQSNHEGVLIDWIHEAAEEFSGMVFNPGGYTHTSIALMDAIIGTQLPTVEVHVSDIFAREKFRRFSYISLVALASIYGHGIEGYRMAIDRLLTNLE